MAHKISTRIAQSSFRGGELEVMLSQAFEERTYRLDVSRRVGIGHDHIVEVGCHLFQAFGDFVDNRGEKQTLPTLEPPSCVVRVMDKRAFGKKNVPKNATS